jgi:hypothetical protein
MKMMYHPKGYLIQITEEDPIVQIVYYIGIHNFVREAKGFTNKLPDGLNALFLEIDNHKMTEREILKHFSYKGIPMFLLASTKRGYHIITRVYAKPNKIFDLCNTLSEELGTDQDYCKLARARENFDFTQILRLEGKYNEQDITVKRWLEPINNWEDRVIQLYIEHAKFHIPVTRLVRQCPMYEPNTDDEILKEGRENHKKLQQVLEFLGYETEVHAVTQKGKLIIEGYADAVLGNTVIEIKPPSEEQIQMGLLQAQYYAAMLNKHTAVVYDYFLREQAHARALEPIAKYTGYNPPQTVCETCMLKNICKKVINIE